MISLGTLDRVIVFDDNGLYLKTFSLPEGEIHFDGDYIVHLTDEHILIQNMFSKSSTSFEIQTKDLHYLGFDGRYLYMAKQQTLLQYLLFK